jgi:hypothetical protein
MLQQQVQQQPDRPFLVVASWHLPAQWPVLQLLAKLLQLGP